MKRIGRMTAIMALALTLGAISIGGALFMPPQAMAQAKKAEPPSPLPAAAPAAVPAIEAPKAEPPAVIKTTEVVENPYGLEALWRQGDWISKGTLIILAIMSVGTVRSASSRKKARSRQPITAAL